MKRLQGRCWVWGLGARALGKRRLWNTPRVCVPDCDEGRRPVWTAHDPPAAPVLLSVTGHVRVQMDVRVQHKGL